MGARLHREPFSRIPWMGIGWGGWDGGWAPERREQAANEGPAQTRLGELGGEWERGPTTPNKNVILKFVKNSKFLLFRKFN